MSTINISGIPFEPSVPKSAVDVNQKQEMHAVLLEHLKLLRESQGGFFIPKPGVVPPVRASSLTSEMAVLTFALKYGVVTHELLGTNPQEIEMLEQKIGHE